MTDVIKLVPKSKPADSREPDEHQACLLRAAKTMLSEVETGNMQDLIAFVVDKEGNIYKYQVCASSNYTILGLLHKATQRYMEEEC